MFDNLRRNKNVKDFYGKYPEKEWGKLTKILVLLGIKALEPKLFQQHLTFKELEDLCKPLVFPSATAKPTQELHTVIADLRSQLSGITNRAQQIQKQATDVATMGTNPNFSHITSSTQGQQQRQDRIPVSYAFTSDPRQSQTRVNPRNNQPAVSFNDVTTVETKADSPAINVNQRATSEPLRIQYACYPAIKPSSKWRTGDENVFVDLKMQKRLSLSPEGKRSNVVQEDERMLNGMHQGAQTSKSHREIYPQWWGYDSEQENGIKKIGVQRLTDKRSASTGRLDSASQGRLAQKVTQFIPDRPNNYRERTQHVEKNRRELMERNHTGIWGDEDQGAAVRQQDGRQRETVSGGVQFMDDSRVPQENYQGEVGQFGQQGMYPQTGLPQNAYYQDPRTGEWMQTSQEPSRAFTHEPGHTGPGFQGTTTAGPYGYPVVNQGTVVTGFPQQMIVQGNVISDATLAEQNRQADFVQTSTNKKPRRGQPGKSRKMLEEKQINKTFTYDMTQSEKKRFGPRGRRNGQEGGDRARSTSTGRMNIPTRGGMAKENRSPQPDRFDYRESKAAKTHQRLDGSRRMPGYLTTVESKIKRQVEMDKMKGGSQGDFEVEIHCKPPTSQQIERLRGEAGHMNEAFPQVTPGMRATKQTFAEDMQQSSEEANYEGDLEDANTGGERLGSDEEERYRGRNYNIYNHMEGDYDEQLKRKQYQEEPRRREVVHSRERSHQARTGGTQGRQPDLMEITNEVLSNPLMTQFSDDNASYRSSQKLKKSGSSPAAVKKQSFDGQEKTTVEDLRISNNASPKKVDDKGHQYSDWVGEYSTTTKPTTVRLKHSIRELKENFSGPGKARETVAATGGIRWDDEEDDKVKNASMSSSDMFKASIKGGIGREKERQHQSHHSQQGQSMSEWYNYADDFSSSNSYFNPNDDLRGYYQNQFGSFMNRRSGMGPDVRKSSKFSKSNLSSASSSMMDFRGSQSQFRGIRTAESEFENRNVGMSMNKPFPSSTLYDDHRR
mmetsp:Transcript_61790/g.70879  ORF Transcript_61790/g.70879 Transcript_61790/m.70879 type:complete len:1006 (+) Transcript_61790:126-3143(+)|eukprot:CAMPEP_0115017778 /NCGR_PEP_ID=MMETSP0216-20121206/28347_1 /TAXON_ID=223996 /ORGANISM="Protocruzia adherens, Strain Boccale" /LENGTH=1005 /DNA_ID=CAMNT_0002388715 /DNA_START=68 /DNA_END=3085 /DNA_ORIENTATION=+